MYKLYMNIHIHRDYIFLQTGTLGSLTDKHAKKITRLSFMFLNDIHTRIFFFVLCEFICN